MISTRRAFLKRTFLGTAALSAARPFCAAMHSGDTPALLFFTEQEHAVLSAVGERLLGLHSSPAAPPPAIDVARRADQFLAEEDPDVQEQLHLLLTIFNSQLAALVFNLRLSSFLDMGSEAQDEYLDGWMTSRLGFRRTGFQALKRLCMSMYYTHPASHAAIGYTPMLPAPEDR